MHKNGNRTLRRQEMFGVLDGSGEIDRARIDGID
jgi:hypothetical protein